jgi:hypothetical protein
VRAGGFQAARGWGNGLVSLKDHHTNGSPAYARRLYFHDSYAAIVQKIRGRIRVYSRLCGRLGSRVSNFWTRSTKVFRRSKGVTLSLRQDSSEFSSALAVGIARAQASRESAVTTRVPAGSFIAFLAILRKGNLANHLYNTNTRC